MKKVLFLFAMACTMLFTSCMEESSYTITYHDDLSSFANLTVFEYDYSYNLVAKREVKNVQNATYEFISVSSASYIVVGVEALVNNHVMEWYTRDIYRLNSDKLTDVYVDFLVVATQSTNPANPNDRVSTYIYK